MSVTVPYSTAPRRESCCDLLNRWISSINNMGRTLEKILALHRSITSRTSFTPDCTALNVKNGACNCCDMMWARVVFPTPGGPQRMKDEIFPPSIIRRSTAPGPTRCSCPMYSSKFLGLSLSARGCNINYLFLLIQIYLFWTVFARKETER